ncbi:MAG: hypothetical protein ACI4GB_07080 [Acutalibacteraceae bacterium]
MGSSPTTGTSFSLLYAENNGGVMMKMTAQCGNFIVPFSPVGIVVLSFFE